MGKFVFKVLVFIGLALSLIYSLILFNSTRRPPTTLISPVGEPSQLDAETFSHSANIWFPEENVVETNQAPPEISATSAIVVDLTTNKTIYAKNIHNRQPIASIVKIMTAIVALEKKHLDDIFTVSQQAAEVGEDSMGITAGEKYTLEQLLYGLLLPSGNDASEAIAENVAGNRNKFIDLMNQKAKVLGLNDTKFVNPSGLDEDGIEQYSTAFDVAVITRYALVNFPIFRKIVSTKFYEISYSPQHKYLYLENQTNLLSTYPGVAGVKPGYTPQAGLCLVTLAENGGHQILAVILGSKNRREEMIKLLDYSFGFLGINPYQ